MLKQPEFDFSTPSRRRSKRAQAAAADVVGLDTETFSISDLRKEGSFKQTRHWSTGAWCAAYSESGGPVQLWLRGEPTPQVFRVPPRRVVSHNATYEFLTVRDVLSRLNPDWAVIPIENFDCTMVRAQAMALPAKLETLATILKLEHKKDPNSQRLMLAMARPMKLRKGEIADGPRWNDDPKKIEQLGERCKVDVLAALEARDQLPPLSNSELQLWLHTFKTNEIGIPIHLDLAHAGVELAREIDSEKDVEITRRSGGLITSRNQIGRIKPFVQERGFRGQSLRRDVRLQQLARTDDGFTDDARCIVELMDGGAHRKLDAIIAHTCPDGRARGGLTMNRASRTGRFGSSGPQFQNMRRPAIKNMGDAVDVVLGRSLKRLKKFAAKAGVSPLAILGSLPRATIRAEDGHELVIADYAQIEPRCIALLANDTRLLDTFAHSDATGSDIYILFAAEIFRVPPSRVTPEMRQIAKTAFLSFQYAGGLAGWRVFSSELTDDEVMRLRDRWRSIHSAICKLWHRLNRAAIYAVKHPGELVRCGILSLWSTGKFLFLELPSKRLLSYPFPSLVTNKYGQTAVSFYDDHQGRFSPYRFGQGAHPGTWVENATQACARDILAAALLRIDASNLPASTILHVHDEVILEARKGAVDPKQLVKLMCVRPSWCLNLPLSATGWCGERYLKP